MGRVAPAPAIVFTGKLGVERIIEALAARGLRRVLSVRDASNAKPPTVEPNAQDDAPNAQDGAETECAQDDASNAKHPTVAPNAQDGADGWADTPVYVGSERWGRGLDLDVDYVFLLAPPASSASYTHLAGRTARKGRRGTAVTLLTPSQAPRVVAFAEALGLAFEAL
jgi:superfamily II DNA/RNA helicase